jgi:hypothetical protein
MSTATREIAVNGRKVTIESNLNDGSYTVKDTAGRLIGSGAASTGGKISFSKGSRIAQQQLLSLSGKETRNLSRDLRKKVQNQVEGENKSILNDNASDSQKEILKNAGYGNGIDIPGDTSAQNENAGAPGVPTGNGDASRGRTDQEKGAASRIQNLLPKRNRDKGNFRYPLDAIGTNHDYVLFNIIKYKAGGADSFGNMAAGKDARISTRLNIKDTIGSFILPMPQTLPVNTHSVSWSEDRINMLQAMGASIVGGALDGGGALGTAVDNTKSGIAASKEEMKTGIKAWAAQQIAKGGNILTRTEGAVMNSNLEVLFGGPNMRQFGFSYKLTPRDNKEVLQIRRMVRMIKRSMSAKLKGANLFLYSPDIFTIEFKFKGNQDHPFLNKIKPCALSSFGVNYSPDGAYMTYADGSPVAYQLDLQFQELEPVYDIDYDSGEGTEGMGF